MPVAATTVNHVMIIVKTAVYRLGNQNSTVSAAPRRAAKTSFSASAFVQEMTMMAARMPSTPTRAAQNSAERCLLGLGRASMMFVIRNMYRNVVRGEPYTAAAGNIEMSVEREKYDTPTSWNITAKNQAIRALATNDIETKEHLASSLAPNSDLSRSSRLLRLVRGSACALLVALMDVAPTGGGKVPRDC